MWESDIDELPYLVPREHGLRTDCWWFEIGDSARGSTLRIDAVCAPLHVAATRHSAGELYEGASAFELPTPDRLVVHIDAAHRGLGTASCGPDVLDRYRLEADAYSFAYRVTLSD